MSPGSPVALIFKLLLANSGLLVGRVAGKKWLLGCGSKNRYQNGTLVTGNMDQNPRNPSSLILSHTHLGIQEGFDSCGSMFLLALLEVAELQQVSDHRHHEALLFRLLESPETRYLWPCCKPWFPTCVEVRELGCCFGVGADCGFGAWGLGVEGREGGSKGWSVSCGSVPLDWPKDSNPTFYTTPGSPVALINSSYFCQIYLGIQVTSTTN